MQEQQTARIARGKQQGHIRAEVNWDTFVSHFENISPSKLPANIIQFVLQTSATASSRVATTYADGAQKGTFIKSLTIRLMSTPEYQLC
jgi:hypothetical protein